MDVLAEFEALLRSMSPGDKAELDKLITPELRSCWLPNPGPQTQALECQADVLLYGGAAGGGKSDLVLGAALTRHEKSVLFRSTYTAMQGLETRLFEIAGRDGWNGQRHEMKRSDGRVLELGALEKPGAEKAWQGRPHDLIGIDEAAQLPEAKVRFVMGWNRSATPGQRCRVILASNPPVGSDGDWLQVWFAPWLDPMFPKPAAPGELRWCVTAADSAIVWVEGPGYYIVTRNENGANEHRLATPEEIEAAQAGASDAEAVEAMSHTFIPAFLNDNPFLRDSGYRANLMKMPEPLRSKLLKGDFMAGKEDAAYQVIPSEWIDLANARWEARKAEGLMTTMGVDVALGGSDETVLAPLYDTYFPPLIKVAGVKTSDGTILGGLIVQHLRDAAPVAIDLCGGWGSGAQTHLASLEMETIPMVASEGSEERTRDGLMGFYNKRAQWWWQFREALDPVHGDNVALPPDRRLKAQLCSPTFKLKTQSAVAVYQIESKDDIRARLGSSTDDADAVIQAWATRSEGLLRGTKRKRPNHGGRKSAWMGS